MFSIRRHAEKRKVTCGHTIHRRRRKGLDLIGGEVKVNNTRFHFLFLLYQLLHRKNREFVSRSGHNVKHRARNLNNRYG